MSGKLLNALQKLDMLYKQKKDSLPVPEQQSTLLDEDKPTNKEQKQPSTLQPQPAIQPLAYPQAAKDKKTIRDEKSERKRRQMCMRKAAGTVWEDPSLADWPDNDYRLFCGNLGNEVSDEVLSNAFRKYKSFCRARVIRDKRTMKTKGFGFVSFLNPTDYLKAFNEMNNKYIGNRPVKIQRSSWKERSLQSKKKDGLEDKFIKPQLRKVKKAQM